ncbi:MAG: hypothetical protein C0623_03380 [Desulfuromonas sp.]|nr:MAG: hypothetical protein C0623_03380 [Desulfuromonas sp.]
MALLIREIKLGLDEDEAELAARVADIFGLLEQDIEALKVIRRGIDARKKSEIKRVYTVTFEVANESELLAEFGSDHRISRYEKPVVPELQRVDGNCHALVVGSGPSGLFAALRLVRQGLRVTLIERGEPVEERSRKVEQFWRSGKFDPRSNVQFGEGGAGTFSDGKLTTRVSSPWCRFVLQTFVDFGAPPEILAEAKPHLGTDVLRQVLLNFRKNLIAAGVDFRFETQLTGLLTHAGRVQGGIVNETDEFKADVVVLAPGHSARDTYAMLEQAGVLLEQKPFAIGLRVEHPAELINSIQYGMVGHKNLPTADYALSYNDAESGRGVYSFCMCPGGEIISAPSESGGMVVNGMSYRSRNQEFSNSALVVSVGPDDFAGRDALAGVRFQRQWEAAAFAAGGGQYLAPAQNLLGFLGTGTGPLRSSCRSGVHEAELSRTLPVEVVSALRRALPYFDRKLKGFVTGDAVLVGIESRTSAPLRIVRNTAGESESHPGLYPAGEGAGYAGGIMSAALDGLKSADRICQNIKDGVVSE